MMHSELQHKIALVDAALEQCFREKTDYSLLLEAMRYSLLAGGKRLRPVFLLAFCEAVGGNVSDAMDAACAVEMVHTYSLIHDDLPCMDNDDYRRGRLTCHKVYGEDIATLAGDALLTAAFKILSEGQGDPIRQLRCVSVLARAAGEHGMVAGQVLDLEGEKRVLGEQELRQVHRHKTGDLISAACRMGVILGGGSVQQEKAAGEFAEALGMAFQIRDDMLDEIGSQEELGKPVGSDEANGKSTFVSLFGLSQCQRMVEAETARGLHALEQGGFGDISFLRELAISLTGRTK